MSVAPSAASPGVGSIATDCGTLAESISGNVVSGPGEPQNQNRQEYQQPTDRRWSFLSQVYGLRGCCFDVAPSAILVGHGGSPVRRTAVVFRQLWVAVDASSVGMVRTDTLLKESILCAWW